MTVWIDKQSYLVRRIDTQTQTNDVRVEETTTYEPIIDADIADDLLKFDPPEQRFFALANWPPAPTVRQVRPCASPFDKVAAIGQSPRPNPAMQMQRQSTRNL